MKKQFLFLLASAALLASCGNNGGQTPSSSAAEGSADASGVPGSSYSSAEEGSVIAPTDASAKLLLASKAIEGKKKIGLDLNADAELYLKSVQKKSEKLGLPQDLTNEINAKVEGLRSTVAFENFGDAKTFAQSTSASAKVTANYKGVQLAQGASAPEERKADLDVNLSAKEYIEDGYSYFDLGDGLDKIGSFLDAIGTFPVSLPPVSKFKTPLSEDDNAKVVNLNSTLAGYVASFATMVADADAAVASVSSDEPRLDDYFVFEAYSNGRYGVKVDVNVTDVVAKLVSSIPLVDPTGKPNVIGQIIVSIIGGFGGKASATAIYSESGVESIEANVNLTYNVEVQESETAPGNTVDATLSLSAKGVFAYDDKVTVEHVENKEEYPEIKEKEEEGSSDESLPA